MKYIVYLTTNVLNNKIYIGVHSTNLSTFDGYIGCGVNINNPSSYKNNKTPFQFAVSKYGTSNFKRVTIQEFDNLQDALDLEESIVDQKFIARKDTYNITVGGGYPPILNKVINQYSLDGKFIRSWNSIIDAANNYKCSESCIGQAVIHQTTSNNFLWTDYKVVQLNINEFNVYSPNKPVFQYNEFGDYEKSFISISEAAIFNKINLSNIQRSIKGGYRANNKYFSFELKSTISIVTNIKLYNTPIYQYSLNGEFIKSFSCMKDLEKEFGCRMDGINSAIRLGGQHKGFQWNRERVDKMKPLKAPKSVARKVGQYTKNGDLVKVFNTVRECRAEFANVSKVLKGLANHCKGFLFKYME